MRFLNIKLIIPAKKIDKDISLKPGINIITTDDEFIKETIPQLPLIAIYGKGFSLKPPEDILETEKYSAAIEADISGKQISFINENSILKSELFNKAELIDYDDLILYSYSAYSVQDGGGDTVLTASGLKRFLINREPDEEKSGNMHRLEIVIAEKEKEINELKKKKELLELKKRKKDKLGKELSVSERELARLRRKRESYLAYKQTLTDILDLIQDDTRLSSKIVNLKKDIIDLRETAEKREALEKEIAHRFPQFTTGMIEKFPDLDRLQAEFNTIRDINEEMEKFNSSKKRRISLALKGITAGLLFAFISMMFILIKSISLNTIAGMLLGSLSSILVLLSAVTGYYLYLLIRKEYPEDLTNRKQAIESGLLEMFKNESFPDRNFGTGELYEYLFQYFEDFLSFRDLQNELTAIKKGANSRTTIEEREEKLATLDDRKNEIRQQIELKLNSLDINIHPAPDRDNIKNLGAEIDEMIAEIQQEEKQKDSIAKKIEIESFQYESGDKSRETIDSSIAIIDSDIEKLKKDISDISFMNKIYNETADEWFSARLSSLTEKCSEIYSRIMTGIKKDLKFHDSIKDLVMAGKSEGFTSEEIAALSLSMKLSLTEISPLPESYPLILCDPFSIFKPEITDKLKKILLELSEKRQVVIITSKSEKNLAGNLINI